MISDKLRKQFYEKNKSNLDNDLKELIKQEGNLLIFYYNGYTCIIKRQILGHLCGYIVIPPHHELYENKYSYDLPMKYEDLPFYNGLTFNEYLNLDSESKFYCIGMDCAHYNDLVPFIPMKYSLIDEETATYKSMKFVKNNLKEVVDHLIKIERDIK